MVFVDIPAGTYNASLKVLDRDGIPLTGGALGQEIVFSGGSTTETVLVAPERWLQSYIGTFFFRIEWGGEDCSTAIPTVARQKLSLVAGGEIFTGLTTDGAAMDGSSEFDCQSLSEEFPQSALDVPFGPAILTVEGIDSMGNTAYESVFDTFVGAGVNNPESVFDVDLSPE